jgi:hypothetical protein
MAKPWTGWKRSATNNTGSDRGARRLGRLIQSEFKKCRSANLERVVWKSRLSASDVWE